MTPYTTMREVRPEKPSTPVLPYLTDELCIIFSYSLQTLVTPFAYGEH